MSHSDLRPGLSADDDRRRPGAASHPGRRRVHAPREGLCGRSDPLPGAPVVTGYAADATFFNNQGPNQQALADQLSGLVEDYLERERPYTPDLRAAAIPADAVTTSASGVDPHISEANARIQANRVAARRGITRERVLEVIEDHASRPLFGLAGERSVNVVELNEALR